MTAKLREFTVVARWSRDAGSRNLVFTVKMNTVPLTWRGRTMENILPILSTDQSAADGAASVFGTKEAELPLSTHSLL